MKSCDRISGGAVIGFALLAGLLATGAQYGMGYLADKIGVGMTRGKMIGVALGSGAVMTALAVGIYASGRKLPRSVTIPAAAGIASVAMANTVGLLQLSGKVPPAPQELPAAGSAP